MLILGVESSCDETALAVIENDKILVNLISSQIENHAPYGGVVPELASRLHEHNFPRILQLLKTQYKLDFNKIDLIAYSAVQGLTGSLHMGELFAKSLAFFLKIPAIAIPHLDGHLFSAHVEQKIIYPFVCFVLSGGHSSVFLVESPLQKKILGSTHDDAIGEAFDKIAQVLKLGYPGGPLIEKQANFVKETSLTLPVFKSKNLDFSYSGLKTAARLAWESRKYSVAEVCHSFQQAAFKQVINNYYKIRTQYPTLKNISITGGVSANKYLRQFFESLNDHSVKIFFPPAGLRTDNAAMIAFAAFYQYKK